MVSMPSRRSLATALAVVTLAVVALGTALVTLVAVGDWRLDAAPVTRSVAEPTTDAGSPAPREVERRLRILRGLHVLRRWDRSRAAAYASGDALALRRLYAPGSAAGAADVGILRSYAARGLVVERMRLQLIDVRVLRHGSRRMVLRVQDRLTGAQVVSRTGARSALPTDQPDTRTLELLRRGTRWVVGHVRGA